MRLNQGGPGGSNASALSIARMGPSAVHAVHDCCCQERSRCDMMVKTLEHQPLLIFSVHCRDTDGGRFTLNVLYSGPLSSPSASFWYGAGTAPGY